MESYDILNRISAGDNTLVLAHCKQAKLPFFVWEENKVTRAKQNFEYFSSKKEAIENIVSRIKEATKFLRGHEPKVMSFDR